MTENVLSEVVELTDLAASRIRRAERKARIRIRRRRMTPSPAVLKATADAAARKELAKELSRSIRKFHGREEIPAVLGSIQDAARINADALSGKPILPASKVFADNTRVERRRGKIEVRAEFQRHFRDIAEDAEELASWSDFEEEFYDDDSLCMCIPGYECYKCSLDAQRARDQVSGSFGYPDEPPCEFYESGSYLDF